MNRGKFYKTNEDVYKIINQTNKFIELQKINVKSKKYSDENDIFGKCEIIYDPNNTEPDIYKISRKKFNKLNFSDFLDEEYIENYKYIYKTVTLNDEINYNCISMLKI